MTQRRNSFGERLGPRASRWLFNLWPAIRGTGSRVEHVADDWSEVRVRLPLSWRTRNYVGTIFGGAIYAAVDPYPMLMLLRRLGPAYVVWDKAAAVRFRRPARGALHATIRIGDELVAQLRERADRDGSFDHDFHVDLVAADGAVHATVTKTLYVATRAAYEARTSSAQRPAGSSG